MALRRTDFIHSFILIYVLRHLAKPLAMNEILCHTVHWFLKQGSGDR